MKILVYTDSRGQHRPAGSSHKIFAERLSDLPDLNVDLYLCPYKWTTLADFLCDFSSDELSSYDMIFVYAGIVDWSPRRVSSAKGDVYDSDLEENLTNFRSNTEVYAKKIRNNKKKRFDGIFGAECMASHLARPFQQEYEGEPTANMYSVEMARREVLPRLLKLDNLYFINSNEFVPGWSGDYWKERPANIDIIHDYAKMFREEFDASRLIDLSLWSREEVMKYTCDNLHLSESGSEYIYRAILRMIDNKKSASEVVAPARPSEPSLRAPQLVESLTAEDRKLLGLTTLIIGVRFNGLEGVRVDNLLILLGWLRIYYGDLFDILLVEQDSCSRLRGAIGELPVGVRHEFIYNPQEYNRGWGYNVAVSRFCDSAQVVVLMDTDVLPGAGFVASILSCHRRYHAVSPYQNIYYSSQVEAEGVRERMAISHLARADAIRNPVTITGGIVAIRRSTYLSVYGFEQYVGYGCEDRALDVTLLNEIGVDGVSVVPEVYVHLHHPADKEARKEFDAIYGHLRTFYGCQYDPKVRPNEFIHKNCEHSELTVSRLMQKARVRSFGDPHLYERIAAGGASRLSINGQLRDADLNEGPYLPHIHSALSSRSGPAAITAVQSAYECYREEPRMSAVVNAKVREIAASFRGGVFIGRSSDTLVVLGNGPSLGYVMSNPRYRDLLRKFDTFGLNAAYRAYDELGFWPTYHGCLDMIVVESHLRSYLEILPRVRQMFLLSEDHLGNDIVGVERNNLVKIRFDRSVRDSNEKVLSSRFDRFRNWQNSGCNCVQIGLMLGYERVILLGMDAEYKELLPEVKLVKDEKYNWSHLQVAQDITSNDNYWFSGYQQVGDKYNIPNAAKYHLPAWNALGESEHASKIVNCSTNTRITTIHRSSFEEEFGVEPTYAGLEDTVLIEGFGVRWSRRVGSLVLCGKLIFLVSDSGGTVGRKFVPEHIWIKIVGESTENALEVLKVDPRQLSSLPYQGVVDSVPPARNLNPGLTFMIRAKNERPNIYFVLGTLKHLLGNESLNCEVVFVDNNSSDGTIEEVRRVCVDQKICSVYLTSYGVEVCPSGEAHSKLLVGDRHRSLDTFYNWCLDRVRTNYVIKWDCDFVAIPGNLSVLLREYGLCTGAEPLAIWCAGKTLFRAGDSFYLNLDTMYNEFRVFSKLHGYRWEYAPRWEICSQDYMRRATKRTFSKCLFLELKDLRRNEFEFRSGGRAVQSDLRDNRDGRIIESLSADPQSGAAIGLRRLDFDPLSPVNFGLGEFADLVPTLEELAAMQNYWLNVFSASAAASRRFSRVDNVVVQGLWVGERLTTLHRMCVESFLKQGHCFVLYVYAPVENVPTGVVMLPAEDIVPQSMVYQFDGSYAGFSDLFRNKLLADRGGWYVDLDIYCLRPFDVDRDMVFSLDYYHESTVQQKMGGDEIIDGKYYVQTNPCKLPSGSDIAKRMYGLIFRKLVLKKVLDVFGRVEPFQQARLRERLLGWKVLADFESNVIRLDKLPQRLSFDELLGIAGISTADVGQASWGELGPTLLTREVVRADLAAHASLPEEFQGVIKYFEVERYLDPSFDYRGELRKSNPRSLDLFYTMWRRRGLLERIDSNDDCLLRYLRAQIGMESIALQQ